MERSSAHEESSKVSEDESLAEEAEVCVTEMISSHELYACEILQPNKAREFKAQASANAFTFESQPRPYQARPRERFGLAGGYPCMGPKPRVPHHGNDRLGARATPFAPNFEFP